jgi:hypothetical protein
MKRIRFRDVLSSPDIPYILKKRRCEDGHQILNAGSIPEFVLGADLRNAKQRDPLGGEASPMVISSPILTSVSTPVLTHINPRPSFSATSFSATSLYNYCVKDPIVDWLKMYNVNQGVNQTLNQQINQGEIKTPDFQSYIFKKGDEFEKHVIADLKAKFPITVISIDGKYREQDIPKVVDALKRRDPIIYSAPLKNPENNTHGVADLIVREDYIEKICGKTFYESKENNKDTYVIVDIKYSTIPLTADGVHILNKDSYNAYKAQLYVYTLALGKIQGYTPHKAFILGRKTVYTSCKKTFKNHRLLGTIDYKGWDKNVPVMVEKGLKWLKALHEQGKEWNPYKPEEIKDLEIRKCMYPNMCHDSGNFESIKKHIAEKTGELTSIWYVGPNNRNIAIDNGIDSWKDEKCSSKVLGLTSRNSVVDKIIKVNRKGDKEDKGDLIFPKKANGELKQDLRLFKDTIEFFIDFETLSDIFTPDVNLYMIGVGYVNNKDINHENVNHENVFTYKWFICHDLTLDCMYSIMKEFSDFLYSFKRDFHLWYWSTAEEQFWKTALDKLTQQQKDSIKLRYQEGKWRNLYKVITSNEIVFKGAFNYKLKTVAKALESFARPSGAFSNPSGANRDPSRGGIGDLGASGDHTGKVLKSSMVHAIEIYKSRAFKTRIEEKSLSELEKDFSDLISYNACDCETVYGILTYLREYYKIQ